MPRWQFRMTKERGVHILEASPVGTADWAWIMISPSKLLVKTIVEMCQGTPDTADDMMDKMLASMEGE